ncbi:hypothetical protein AVEN_160177-1 [Araneus ventricosus]|uniref:Uncharacterized protein n=1 Tax=Araneus ventricosus TaxID=182803 RepID=A0A4Y2UBJ4_ARAVE|nr:hypothetical protein AVEN_160177-1 [Araneus ventricosus]
MADKRNKRQVLSQTRKLKDSKNTNDKKPLYLHRLKGNYALELSSIFWGVSNRKEGASTPYAQGHIGGEPEPSKPLSEDGRRWMSSSVIPPL